MSGGFVPDASITLPWCFPDEATPWTESLLNRVVSGEPVLVPAHWSIEVLNGLLMAVRRRRVTRTEIEEFMEDIGDLPIQIEPARSPDTWPAAMAA